MVEEPLTFRVDLHIQRIPNTPVTSNCFVLHELNRRECLILDPGSDDNSTLMAYLTKYNLLPKTVILTHEHFDHIWGVHDLSNYFAFELICNEVCASAIGHPKKNLSFFHDLVGFSVLNEVTTVEKIDHRFSWNGKKFKFIQTPGHSEGSIGIQCDGILFCGDLLIQNEKTVTKLPGGSLTKLKKTLSELKSELSPETLIHSGHGKSFLFKDYYIYHEL
jgi:glyoxylase-like metal-dependent hydrolase (beta-lactamase superfamily II)